MPGSSAASPFVVPANHFLGSSSLGVAAARWFVIGALTPGFQPREGFIERLSRRAGSLVGLGPPRLCLFPVGDISPRPIWRSEEVGEPPLMGF